MSRPKCAMLAGGLCALLVSGCLTPTDASLNVSVVELEVEGRVEARMVLEGLPCPFFLPAGIVAGRDLWCGQVVTLAGSEAVFEDLDEGPSTRAAASTDVPFSFFRVPAQNPSRKPPLFIHFGGPGSNGLRELSAALSMRYTLGTDRDMVVVAQKGTTFSTPFFECQDNQSPDFTRDLDSALLRESSNSISCRNAIERAGYDIHSFLTPAAVRDLEAVRLALYPKRKIALYGVSYGSTFALEMARQFPRAIDSITLDSVITTDFDRDEYFVRQFVEYANYLDTLSKQCNADSACTEALNVSAVDFRADFVRVLAIAETEPVAILPDLALSQQSVLWFGRALGMDPTTRDLYAFLLHGLAQPGHDLSEEGISLGLLRAFEAYQRLEGFRVLESYAALARLFTEAPPNRDAFSYPHNEVLGCIDLFSVDIRALRRRISAAATLEPPLSSAILKAAERRAATCAGYGGFSDAQDVFRQPVSLLPRALILAASFDPASPNYLARSQHARAKDAWYYESSCAAHGVLAGSLQRRDTCSTRLMRTFLDGAALSSADFDCLCADERTLLRSPPR